VVSGEEETTEPRDGGTGMSELHRIEIEINDYCYEALLSEADRLNLGVEQVVQRAAVAWITDLAESTPTANCTPTVTLVS
jgi:hypothetical protein